MNKIIDPYRVITGAEQPDLVKQANQRIGAEWPEFMLHDPVSDGFVELYEKFPEYQFVLVDRETEEVVSIANSIPLRFDSDPDDLPDDGWDWAMTQGLGDLAHNRQCNLQSALQVVVFGDRRGRSISGQSVRAMKEIGRRHGLKGMIAPVRPSQKCDYPLTPINSYVKWTAPDGELPFDAWLRVHARSGARIIKPCPTAMRIEGTIAEWESWTKMRFPDSGDYIVPGALVPVKIDVENDRGLYIEPNVWVYHDFELVR